MIITKEMFSLSANIENGFAVNSQYIVTPNAQRTVSQIVKDFQIGIHSFTIIGSYGTGKSSFLLAFESDLLNAGKSKMLFDPIVLGRASNFEIVNIVGDYVELSTLLRQKFRIEGSDNSILDDLKNYYNRCQKEGKFLVIVLDEFGKVLEHAAKNNPERELYFLQKFAEFINTPSRNLLLLTTLHQNFSSYVKGLTQEQVNEWIKVKGRFKEIAFVEPIEQLLYLASKQLQEEKACKVDDNAKPLFELAKDTKFVSADFPMATAMQLYPLDLFSAFSITSAIQRYGQNERSLFTFLASRGINSIMDFTPTRHLTYNLARVYDYIIYNFSSYLKDANVDSMSWSSIQFSIERVEGNDWDSKEQIVQAINLVKAIGLLNLFGSAGFKFSEEHLAKYAYWAMGIYDAETILRKLVEKKIIRYAVYKERFVLFEGTDVDLEGEIRNAGLVVPRPVAFVDELSIFFNKRISPVKAYFYQRGTPRYFDYLIREEPLDILPSGDTDGYIELIFSSSKNALKEIQKFSASSDNALIFAYFKNTDEIVNHLYNIKKYAYLLEKVISNEDKVAVNEIHKLKEYEEVLLNKSISDSLFAYKQGVVWFFKGEEQRIESHKDFNRLLSRVCDEIYDLTPVINNELFNKHKLSASITSARKNYLSALVNHYSEINLGFPADKFPPEKTIYISLLGNTGLHVNGEFVERPANDDILPLWNACEEFLDSTVNKARRISELAKILSTRPYKMKQGVLDFWIPTYLFMKRQDFALYDVSTNAYIPNVNVSFFDLLQKHPADYAVKKFAVDGIRLGFFNQYRRFINLGDEFSIKADSFIETIKPFLFFYNNLNDYTKNTRKFDHHSTMDFRDALAKAQDPEKAFFEDLPDALGFSKAQLKQEEFINEYGKIIMRAIRELRSCYTQLIDRIEQRLVDGFGLQSYDYVEYVHEIQSRLKGTKIYLLTGKQKEFYHHVMAEYDNRELWYQSICYPILGHRLDALYDEEEDKLVDDLIYMLRECEKYADFSHKDVDLEKSDAYSFDLVTNRGTHLRTQTYILAEKDRTRSLELEKRIGHVLSGDLNLDICTLLSILNKKMS